MTSIHIKRLIEVLAVLSSPLVVWFVLYLVDHHWPARLRRTFAFMREARWVGMALAVIFWLVHETRESFPSILCAGCMTFSVGLTFTERWVKAGIAPDQKG